jgi:VanZ family protein
MMNNRSRIVLLVLYTGMIFFLSSRPHLKPPGVDLFLMDKVIHFVEYAILGVLLFEGIGRTIMRNRLFGFFFLLAVGSSIGALDEIFQSYIPGRHMSIYDYIADTAGVAAGVSLALLWRLRRTSVAKNRAGMRSGEG